MCGIVGIASTEVAVARDWLLAGRDAMAHRGPDDKGEYWSTDGRVGLGHRRLSIIDLSSSGHQPMQTSDGHLCIAFNGEIYNFKALRQELEGLGHAFRSSSDTEVILAAYRQWGRSCLSRLHGMFALAIHDRQANTVLLARDRAGEKPLFYRFERGEIRFASELKALMADPAFPRKIDRQSLDCYLTMGYVPGERSILEGTRKLPAAHALLFDCATGSVEVWRYWSLPDYDPAAKPMPDAELLDTLEGLLQAAVQRQLVADVPVGLLLSGGVDSSLITALAVRGGSRPKTFTVGFRDFAEYDETEHANLIAKHFATDHTVLEADEVQPGLLPLLARQYDEPMVDSSMIPTWLVTRQISRHCKVALGGDGGDELFGGYYSASRMASLQQNYSRAPIAPRRSLSHIAVAVLPIGSKGRHFFAHLGADIAHDVPLFMPQFDKATRGRLMARYAGWPLVAEDIRQSCIPSASDAVQRVTRFDFVNYMAEDILVKVDRASMLNSLEVRSPFLDTTVVEFAYRDVPSRLKATPADRKIILKQLAGRILPPEFDKKRKMGFGIPLGHWLKAGPWRQLFEEVLLDKSSIFDRREVSRLFYGMDANRSVKEHLFGLALFELWRKEYGAAL